MTSDRIPPLTIPLDVPQKSHKTYLENLHVSTRGSGHLMLFAGDQKVEHLNDDFSGPGIHPDDGNPEHIFRIADRGKIGLFATHLGLIARYGQDYSSIPYLVKMNGKTNLLPKGERDPESRLWWDVPDIIEFGREAGLSIHGVGYTLYPGSEFEALMLKEAAHLVHQAHTHGLLTVLWIYPRGRYVKDEKDPHLIAGAAGLGAALGSDFVKVNYPQKNGISSPLLLQEATRAAGRTKVICAGGPATDGKAFLETLHGQIHIGGAAGNATGRNIHQRSLEEAVRICNAIYAITVEGASIEEAFLIYKG